MVRGEGKSKVAKAIHMEYILIVLVMFSLISITLVGDDLITPNKVKNFFNSDMLTASIIGAKNPNSDLTNKIDPLVFEKLESLSITSNNNNQDYSVPIIVILKDQSIKTTNLNQKENIDTLQTEFLEELSSKANVFGDDGAEKRKVTLTKNLETNIDKVIALETELKSKDQGLQVASNSEISKIVVSQKFNSISALALEVSNIDDLYAIANSNMVENILLDKELQITMDDTVPMINADDVWNLSELNTNLSITGLGETVCIIDTGVDYTHTSLGSCSLSSLSNTTGNIINLTTTVESDHPYNNSEDITYTINMSSYGLETMAIHFDYIDLEGTGSWDTTDRIYIYNEDMEILAIYHENYTDHWSPSSNGSVMYVRLTSDISATYNGFVVDKVINGTTDTGLNWSNCTKVIGGYDTRNDDFNPMDDHSHGTHIAGTISSTHATYTGVAPNASIVALKSQSSGGSGYLSDVLTAFEWCTSNSEDLNISVISMSLGDGTQENSYCDNTDDYTTLFATAFGEATDKNISIVVATGNEGYTSGINFPACMQDAIPVGSVSKLDVVASSSNRGDLLKLFAPGVNIVSTNLGGGVTTKSGTSMATPHVSGAIALFNQYSKAAYGKVLTPKQIEDKLFKTGVLIDDTSNSGNNYSRIDVLAALKPIINISSPSPENNSEINSTNIIFNASSDVDLSTAILEIQTNINYTNYTMTSDGEGSDTWHYYSYTLANLTEDVANYSIYGNDSLNLFGISEIRTISTVSQPNISEISITPYPVYTDDIILFEVNITDDDLDNSSVILEIDTNDGLKNYSMNLINNTTGSFNFSFDVFGNLTALDNVSIQVYANDFSTTLTTNAIAYFTVQNYPVDFVNITLPNNNTIVEIGNSTSFTSEASDNDSDNLTVYWDFDTSDNNNSLVYAYNTTHTYYSEGTFEIMFNASDLNSSLVTYLNIIVNDTTAPEIISINYTSGITMTSGSSKNQTVSLEAYDYSNFSEINLYDQNNTLINESSSAYNSRSWTFGDYETFATYNFTVELIDNSSNLNSYNQSYTFTVSEQTTSSSGGGGGRSPTTTITNTTEETNQTTITETTETSSEETTNEATTIIIPSNTEYELNAKANQKYSLMTSEEDRIVRQLDIIINHDKTIKTKFSEYLENTFGVKDVENVYAYLDIDLDIEKTDINTAEVFFKVPINLYENIDISLYTFEEDTELWSELKTELDEESTDNYDPNNYNVYKATIEHFSYFAIAKSGFIDDDDEEIESSALVGKATGDNINYNSKLSFLLLFIVTALIILIHTITRIRKKY